MSENGAVMGGRLLTPRDVAEQLGIPLATLYGWNSRGVGPKYMKLGIHCRYRPEDVREFENSRYVDQAAEQTGTPAA